MKRLLMIAAAVPVLALAVYFGFRLYLGKTVVPIGYGGSPVEFESFALSRMGMSAWSDVIEAVRTEKGVSLEHYSFLSHYDSSMQQTVERKYPIRSLDGGEELYESLCTLLGNCRIEKWDGFDGKNPPGISDGDTMSLQVVLKDGKKITASGTNNFPENYRELTAGLSELIDFEVVSSQELQAPYYSLTLPRSWIGKVRIHYADTYISFSAPKQNGEAMTFFIIDCDEYLSSSDSNVYPMGMLQKEGGSEEDVYYLQGRELYELSIYGSQLSENVKDLADTIEEDRQSIINSIRPALGYILISDDAK